MKRALLFLAAILSCSVGCPQSAIGVGETPPGKISPLVENFEEGTLASEYFGGEERTFRVFLPENYSAEKKYPVIYVLDGDFLFPTVMTYVGELTRGAAEGYENIPPSIVVGIVHNDRYHELAPNLDGEEYREGSVKLKNFIERELVPRIDAKYSTSGYNVLVGHSDSGHFALKTLLGTSHPFGGIIALSVAMKKNALWDTLTRRLSSPAREAVFVGYGRRDDDFNEFAESLAASDPSNPNLKVAGFNAGHLELPAIALVEGLGFMFGQYRNFDDFSRLAAEDDFSMEEYAARYVKGMRSLYGIEAPLTAEDCFHLVVRAVKDKNAKAFRSVMEYIERTGLVDLDSHTWFWLTRNLGDWEVARDHAYKMVASGDAGDQRILAANIAAYIDFFVGEMKKPAEAVDFLRKAMKNSPEYESLYTRRIAEIEARQNEM